MATSRRSSGGSREASARPRPGPARPWVPEEGVRVSSAPAGGRPCRCAMVIARPQDGWRRRPRRRGAAGDLIFKIILDQDHFCSMFFHSATVAELFLTIERTTYTIRRVRDTALEPLAAPSLEEPAVLFLRRPAGFESDQLFSPLNFCLSFPSSSSSQHSEAGAGSWGRSRSRESPGLRRGQREVAIAVLHGALKVGLADSPEVDTLGDPSDATNA